MQFEKGIIFHFFCFNCLVQSSCSIRQRITIGKITKQLKCPCCKKQFKRIAQHLSHRPKCSLFLKKYLTRLDANTLYKFQESTLSSIGNNSNIETMRTSREENILPVEINFNFSLTIQQTLVVEQNQLARTTRGYTQMESTTNTLFPYSISKMVLLIVISLCRWNFFS